jgi:hypothetical protein
MTGPSRHPGPLLSGQLLVPEFFMTHITSSEQARLFPVLEDPGFLPQHRLGRSPHWQKKGLYFKREADVCPLCGIPDSLDHVILRCTHLSSKRPYEYGASPKSGCYASAGTVRV